MADSSILYTRPQKVGDPYRTLVDVVSSDFWGSPVIRTDDGRLVCPGFEGNTYARSPWDYVVFGQKSITPGIATVSVQKRRLLDKQKNAGQNYARLTYTGLEPAIVDIQLTIWTPDQWEAFKILWANLFPLLKSENLPAEQPTSDSITPVDPNWPPAFQINHPALTPHFVSAVAVLGADGPMPGWMPNSRMVVIHTIEYQYVPSPTAQQQTTSRTQSAVSTISEVRASVIEPKPYPRPSENADRGPG